MPSRVRITVLALALALALAGSGWALAQPASGPAAGASAPRGGMMGPRYGAGVTPGWSMMSPEERAAHQKAMSEMHNAGDCRTYMDQHHQLMQQRAKDKGAAVPAQPPHDVCSGLPK